MQELFEVALRVVEIERLVARTPPAVGAHTRQRGGDHLALDRERLFGVGAAGLRQALVGVIVCARCLKERDFALLEPEIGSDRLQHARSHRRAQIFVIRANRVDDAQRRVDHEVFLRQDVR